MVISRFADFNPVENYINTRRARLDEQILRTQNNMMQRRQAAFQDMLGQIEDPQRRMEFEMAGVEGAPALIAQRDQEKAAVRAAQQEAEAARRAQVQQYGMGVATRRRQLAQQEGFNEDEFMRQAYDFGVSEYGMQMPYEQFVERARNPMAGEMPDGQGRFEIVEVGGRQFQRGPDGRLYEMPGEPSGLDRLAGAVGALAAGQAESRATAIPNEVDRDLAEERFGPGARAQWVVDARGNTEMVEVGERPFDRAREEVDLGTAEERLETLRVERERLLNSLERERNEETRDQIRMDIAENEAERERIQFEQEQEDRQRERESEIRQEARRRATAIRGSQPIMRDARNLIDLISQNPNAVGDRLDQGIAALFTSSDQGRLAAFLDTITAEAAFSRLQEMRDSSPTGGALGQVTERELDLLKNSRGRMSLTTPADVIVRNVADFNNVIFEQSHGSPEQVEDWYDRGIITADQRAAYYGLRDEMLMDANALVEQLRQPEQTEQPTNRPVINASDYP